MSKHRFPWKGATRIGGAATLLLVAGFLLGGCEATPEMTGPEPLHQPAFNASPRGVTATAAGGGHFDFIVPWHFAFNAVQRDPITLAATGNWQFSAEFAPGVGVDLRGRITCMSADAEKSRAWMGGVVTKNDSTHPFFTGPNSAVGKDVWFRVVDYGEGAGASQPDRTSRIFFHPTGGFTFGQEFCETRLWFDGDPRGDDFATNSLLNGNIEVRVHE